MLDPAELCVLIGNESRHGDRHTIKVDEVGGWEDTGKLPQGAQWSRLARRGLPCPTVSLTQERYQLLAEVCVPVRLGNSGLRVSKIILGCMSYGSKDWFGWVLPEEEGLKHIKAA